jgi:hypothetical protein
MTTLSREERIARQETNLAAKRSRSAYPTMVDMVRRPAAIARVHTFENLNFVAKARQDLLAGGLSLNEQLRAKTLIHSALQMARRNGETAKFMGCALYRF